MFSPIGSVHCGLAATIPTHAWAARWTALPVTTSIRDLRAMTTETGPVLAEHKVVHGGRRQTTAEGRLFVESSGN